MANQSIADFKSQMIGGGARANLFSFTLNVPAGLALDVRRSSFLVKATQLPSSINSPITVPFRGRQLQLAGDRQFEPWSINVINDTDMSIRNTFEQWVNLINNNVTNTGLQNPSDYSDVDMAVDQLDKAGNSIKQYIIRGVWPSNISAIDLSNDSENTIEEFSVELQMMYWESVDSNITV